LVQKKKNGGIREGRGFHKNERQLEKRTKPELKKNVKKNGAGREMARTAVRRKVARGVRGKQMDKNTFGKK